MAIFPRIQSPCPYRDKLATVMDGDLCRLCDRRVFDLTAMTDAERVAFMNGCASEVCVSYKLPLAALAMAATLGAPMTAAAQEMAPEELWIIVGGVKNLASVEYVEVPADAALPELPVIYEDPAPEKEAAAPVRSPDEA